MNGQTVDLAAAILVRYEALSTLVNEDSDISAVRVLLDSINQDFRLFLDFQSELAVG